jgi:hypothetical protein
LQAGDEGGAPGSADVETSPTDTGRHTTTPEGEQKQKTEAPPKLKKNDGTTKTPDKP